MIALPQGSTVIDFAYSIHSGVGNSMIGAKINGMIVPIDRAPETGDIVEILTSSASKGPSRDWLNIVKTSEARTKIRGWFKKEKRADNIVAGKAMIENEIRKFTKSCTESLRHEMVTAVGKRLGFMSADDLYNTLGYGGISMGKLSGKLRDEYERNLERIEAENAEPITVEQIKTTVVPKTVKASGGGIVVDGEVGCQVKFARCCNPLPGDEVIGFITKGYGISIHKCDCPNVKSGRENPENAARWVEAYWQTETSGGEQAMYEAQLTVYVEDRLGIVADISVALSEMRVFLLQINTTASGSDRSLIHLKISCKNIEHYHSIVSRLKSISGVIDVTRGFS